MGDSSNKNNNNNNKNNKNKTPDFSKHSENKIYSKNGKKKDYFGYALSLYDNTLAIGAHSASPVVQYSGAVYLYQKNISIVLNKTRTTWVETNTLIGTETSSHDSFGASVSLWDNNILIGAHLDDKLGTSAGSAYIFEKQGEPPTWQQTQRLAADDGVAGNYFGFSTALYGDLGVVGAHGWAVQGSLVGAAYIFRKGLTSWSLEAKITPSDVQEFLMFSYSVSVLPQLLVAGAYGERTFGTNTGNL